MGAVQSVGGSATSGKGLADHHIRAAIIAALEKSQNIDEPIDNKSVTPDHRREVHNKMLMGDDASKLFKEEDYNLELSCECVVDNDGTAPSSTDKDKLEVVEYAPDVFHALRLLGGTSDEDFTREWTKAPPRANTTADVAVEKEKSAHEGMQLGEGRSGALFLKSKSMAFMCKTISETEVEVLVSILKRYLTHVEQYPDSMLMRFVMMLRVTLNGEVGYILCFSDCFSNCDTLNERWDLKGRKPKPGKFRHFPNHALMRNEVEPEVGGSKSNKPSPDDAAKDTNIRTADSRKALKLLTYKDKNLARLFWLEPEVRNELILQISKDFEFLQGCGLMDYSILIGVKYNTQEEAVEKELKRDQTISSRVQSKTDLKPIATSPQQGSPANRTAMRTVFALGDESTKGAVEKRPVRESVSSPLQASGSDADPLSSTQLFLNQLNNKISKFHQGVENLECGETYYIGIIDMLTVYNGKKKTANFCKKFLWREDTLSTIPPEKYEMRIRKYAHQIFPMVVVQDDVIAGKAVEPAEDKDGIVGKNNGIVRVQSVRFSNTRRTDNQLPPTQSLPAPDVTSGAASDTETESEGEAFLNATSYPTEGNFDRPSDLIKAAGCGDDAAVKKMLKEQADLNEKDDNGMTPLHHAAGNGRLKVVKSLIDAKVDVTAVDTLGRNALHHAAMDDSAASASIAKALIADGIDIDAQDRAGCTALHHAVENMVYDVIQVLIDAKANLNLPEEEGMTPLKCAVENDDDNAAEMLRAAGALENLEDN